MGQRGSKPILPSDKKVVIVGAGYGGAILGLKLLQQKSDFTIIDVKDSFYHNIGGVRAVIEPDFVEKLFIPYEKTFGSRFKQGYVVSINPEEKKVTLKTGEEISYDILVIATGSAGLLPYRTNVEESDLDHVIQPCKDAVKKVQGGKDFVVIGGGAVGCEIACELSTDLKNVNVTLIHSSNTLVADFGEKFQDTLKYKLKCSGVNLLLDEKVTEGVEDSGVYGPCEVVTDKGTKVTADVVFRCTGGTVNSQAYKASLSEVVNDNGALQVNEFLQVKGYKEIFALGDCTDVKEPKLAFRAGEQVKILLPNINALYNDGQLLQYDPAAITLGIGLSLGRYDSVACTVGGYMIPSFIITWYKSKDLFVGRYWKNFMQPVPR